MSRPLYDVVIIRDSKDMRKPVGPTGERRCWEAGLDFCRYTLKANIVFGNMRRKAAVYYGNSLIEAQRFSGDALEQTVEDVEAHFATEGEASGQPVACHIEDLCAHIAECLNKKAGGPKAFGKGVYRIFILTCLDGRPRPVDFLPAAIRSLSTKVDLEFFVHLIEPFEGGTALNDSHVPTDCDLLRRLGRRAIVGWLEEVTNFKRQWLVSPILMPFRQQHIWEISPDLRIPVMTVKKVQKNAAKPLQMAVKSVTGLQSSFEGKIRQCKTFVLEDDEEVEVQPDLIIKGFKYGRQVVPVPDVIMKQINAGSPKELKVLHFSKANAIRRSFLLDTAFQVLVNSQVDRDVTVFKAITRAMVEESSVAICRYVYANTLKAKLVGLIPQLNSFGQVELFGFMLPTEECIRDYIFPMLPQATPQQKAVIEHFVEANEILGTEFDPGVPIDPSMQRWNHWILSKQVKSHKVIFETVVEENIRQEIFPPLPKIPAGFVEAFGFKEKTLKNKVAKEKIFWSSHLENLKHKMEDGEQEKVQAEEDLKAEDKADFEDAYRQTPGHISGARPLRDFEAMLNDRSTDKTEEAIKQMIGVILRFAKESVGESMLPKAIECCQVLRKSCIKEDEWSLFNDFVRQVKQRSEAGEAGLQGLWAAMVQEAITLISSVENRMSDVSDVESLNFIYEAEGRLPSLHGQPMEAERKSDGLNDIE